MTQEVQADDPVVEELKKKHNLSDEALAEIAQKLSIATPLPQTGERREEPSGGGLFGEMDEAELRRMQGFMGGGDISLSGVILLTEMWDRQDRRREERERRRDEEPAWAKRLTERITAVEAKSQPSPTTVPPVADPVAQKLYDDLKEQLKELKSDNKTLLDKLQADAEKAKDEAQRQLIESKMNEVKGQMATIQSAIDGLRVTPEKPKDIVDQYLEAKGKLESANILKPDKASAVKTREEVRARGQDMILKHVDEAATNIGRTLEDIKNSVVIPRLRVESGVANTSGLTEKERQDYYSRLKITQ